MFRYRGHCAPNPNFQISNSICFVKQTFAKIIGLDLNPQDFPSEFSTIGTHLLKHYREINYISNDWTLNGVFTTVLLPYCTMYFFAFFIRREILKLFSSVFARKQGCIEQPLVFAGFLVSVSLSAREVMRNQLPSSLIIINDD